MKATVFFTFVLLASTFTARADFSYSTTSKTTGGAMAAMAGGMTMPSSKHYFKGQKMKTETGDTATIIDFNAQTMTIIDNKRRTVSVRNLADLGAVAQQSGMSMKIDVKETGQKKSINGYNASELIMTMDMDSPQMQQAGMGKMRMEMDMWLSSDVPGIGEMRDFYKANMERIPWAAMSGSNRGMQAGMAEMQRKMAEMNGVQVLSVMKMKSAGGGSAMPQMSEEQRAQMQAAMEKMKEMQKQGGPAAAAAAQAMARMGAMAGGSTGASDSMMEVTTESTGFSTASIPDSVFAIPAGYKNVEPK